jgi:hypothetical protein
VLGNVRSSFLVQTVCFTPTCVLQICASCALALKIHSKTVTDSAVSLLLSLRQERVFTFHLYIAEEMIIKRKGDFR